MSREEYKWSKRERDLIWDIVFKGMNGRWDENKQKERIVRSNLNKKIPRNTKSHPFDIQSLQNGGNDMKDTFIRCSSTPNSNMRFNRWKGLFYFDNLTHFFAFVNINVTVPTIEITQTGIRLEFQRPRLTNGIMKAFGVEPELICKFREILNENEHLTEEWFIPSKRKLVTFKSEDYFKIIRFADTEIQWLGFKIPYVESPVKENN
ncbi:hypothetical protein HDV04_000627 [Boothiomyces sp. JEL0838]|nr:hypothetical protein HDV04_000627 [Boothiomyces sp. JEL0838]